MHWFLLAPIGIPEVPRSLEQAVASYLDARSHATNELGVAVHPRLGRQVIDALLRHGLISHH
jgi:hypothetical protein